MSEIGLLEGLVFVGVRDYGLGGCERNRKDIRREGGDEREMVERWERERKERVVLI